MNGVSRRIYVVVAIVLGAYGVSRGLQIATAPPEVEMPGWRLEDLPRQLGNWRGEGAELDEKVAAATGAEEIENRIYRDDVGHVLSVHAAMFTDPNVGVYHSPLNCYAANGWKKLNENTEMVSVLDGLEPSTVAVDFVGWERDNETIIVAYWYQLGNHVLHSRADLGNRIRWEMRGQSKWPVLMKVMIQIPVIEGQDSKKALLGFTELIGKWLNQPEHQKYLGRWGHV